MSNKYCPICDVWYFVGRYHPESEHAELHSLRYKEHSDPVLYPDPDGVEIDAEKPIHARRTKK
jgi:hypothetical protein